MANVQGRCPKCNRLTVLYPPERVCLHCKCKANPTAVKGEVRK